MSEGHSVLDLSSFKDQAGLSSHVPGGLLDVPEEFVVCYQCRPGTSGE
jgi:hypothetical protein